ncbi:cyclophilin-like fold protein [Enterococcus sp. AZ196]|uniref:cyclophilin-like fold protein n=1 Tax=Enterococcus sp. AZ196 TaxID=2774659 RepID=UPI003D2B070F
MKFLRMLLVIGLLWSGLAVLSTCSATEKSTYDQSTERTKEERVDMLRLQVNGNELQIEWETNPTAKKLQQLLPKKFTMQDLHQNEKYYDLPENLPSEAKKVGKIEAGDIMLYGERTLVVFYQSFDTSYSYTRVGRIVNNQQLIEQLGNAQVEVERIN